MNAIFTCPQLTHYAEASAMRDWLRAAPSGHELIYATGPALGDHAAKRLALEWQAAGEVQLFQRRSTRAHCFDYTARRVIKARAAAVPNAKMAANGGGIALRLYELPPEELALFELVREIAEAGAPCPTNDSLARRLGLKGGEQARYRFNNLCTRGFLKVIEPARFGARVVEVTTSGARTGNNSSSKGAPA